MPQSRKVVDEKPTNQRRRLPATTPEARENQLIALAVDLVEQQLLDGTISNQVLLQLIKRASSKDRVEEQILEKKKDLITAQTDQLKKSANMEELYKEAIEAMRRYGGEGDLR